MKHICTTLQLLHTVLNFPLYGSFQRSCLRSRSHTTFQNKFFMGSFSLSSNPHSWRTTSCQLSSNAYSIYVQWPFHTLRPSPQSATWRYADAVKNIFLVVRNIIGDFKLLNENSLRVFNIVSFYTMNITYTTGNLWSECNLFLFG